jgi:hypothetical protein
MSDLGSSTCRKGDCSKNIPASLLNEQLCLEHFLDEAFVRTNAALALSEQAGTLDHRGVEHLLTDALAVVENLEASADEHHPAERDRMLELLLIIANLHEYMAVQKMVSSQLPS